MSLPKSKALAVLCQASYDDHDIKAGDTEVLISKIGEYTVFTFTGTKFNGLDIIKDLRAYPWWASEMGGFVHRGFLVGVRDIMPQLLPLIPTDAPYVLDGHSKGGSEAILAGAAMVKLGNPPALIETFGAPRAAFGWIETALEDIPVICHRNGTDIVPTVPHRFPFPYRHPVELTNHWNANPDVFHNHKISQYIAAV